MQKKNQEKDVQFLNPATYSTRKMPRKIAL